MNRKYKWFLFILGVFILFPGCISKCIPESGPMKVLFRITWREGYFWLLIEDDYSPGIGEFRVFLFPENGEPISLGYFAEGEKKKVPCISVICGKYYGRTPPLFFQKVLKQENYLPEINRNPIL